MANFFSKYIFKIIAGLNIAIVSFILLDYCFEADMQPKIYDSWDAESGYTRTLRTYSRTYRPYLLSSDGEKFYINNGSILNDYLHQRDTFYVTRTYILKQNKIITLNLQTLSISENVSLFGTFIFWVYLMTGLCSLGFLLIQKSSFMQGILGLSTVLVACITIAYFCLY